MEIKLIYMILLLFFVKAFRAVKINKITVPSYHLENSENEPIILECDFMVDENATGFVLKWHHNTKAVYQWIPPRKPFALLHLRNRTDLNYEASNDPIKKYSSLVITEPLTSDSGNYTCSVQTFDSSDKMTSSMVVVHHEQSINMEYKIDDEQQIVSLKCSIYNIYPLPDVKFLFDNEEKSISVQKETELSNNLFNVTITAQLSKNDIPDESKVTCCMKINDTDYEKRKTITYDDPNQMPTTKITIDGENMLASEYNVENDGIIFQPNFGMLIFVLLNVIIAQIL